MSDIKIPKIIHYCWFGGNPLPEMAQRCIASWKKYCPDYEIKEWNESNFDVNICNYTEEAAKSKKWAFVSDYARFWILYKYGGLYFDTDVELIQPIDDLVVKGSFMGLEKSTNGEGAANPGLGLAAAPGLGLYKEFLDSYRMKHFIRPDGSLDTTTIVTNTTKILKGKGWQASDTIQTIGGITIYPSDYFCPLDYITGKLTTTGNTRSIHHYMASWHTEEDKYYDNLKDKIGRVFPTTISSYLAKYISICKYRGFSKGNKFLIAWINRKTVK
jgi:mannosyltransferase OCH1-like enzyme